MSTLPSFDRLRVLRRANLPVAMLIALLQRSPVVRFLEAAGEALTSSPLGAVLRSAFAASASLGALHSLAGATVLAPSMPGPLAASVGAPITPVAFTVTDTINIGSWKVGGTVPPGVVIEATQGMASLTGPGILDATTPGADDGYGGQIGGNATTTPLMRGVPSQPGTYNITLQAFEFGGTSGLASNTFTYTVNVAGSSSGGNNPPTFSTQPSAQAANLGSSVTLNTAASAGSNFQWQRNGTDVSGGTNPSLTLDNLAAGDTGIYTVVASNSAGSVASLPAIVGLSISTKVVGSGSEVGTNILHPTTGNTYDQILLDGPAAATTADPGQVLRISYIDMNDDIVQVEFAGAGTLSLVLDGSSGPASPAKYNQAVNYMRGQIGIVVTGANETSNLSVFSVGRGNAVNQALFRGDVTYDGLADIAFIAISSSNGKFGGLRTANANYFATKGFTGVYAPGVEFTGPVFMGDISAFDNATPVIMLGSATDVRITGGDLEQANGRAVQVSGITQLKMAAGTTSHYVDASTPSQFIGAKANKGRLEQNGTDITSQIVQNP